MDSFNRSAMIEVSAVVRPLLKRLPLLERLEMCGTWALMECIQAGHSDESIAQMFDVMKDRMLRQAIIYRESLGLLTACGFVEPEGATRS